MMIRQARKSLLPYIGSHHPLRAYPANSPRAKARLLVLALLADGRLDEREMAMLNRQNAFADLGITRENFTQVLNDFCSDVAQLLPAGSGAFELSAKAVAGLLGEISDRDAREKLLRLVFLVISSDGRLSDAEKGLLRSAIDHWTPDSARVPAGVFPEPHYG